MRERLMRKMAFSGKMHEISRCLHEAMMTLGPMFLTIEEDLATTTKVLVGPQIVTVGSLYLTPKYMVSFLGDVGSTGMGSTVPFSSMLSLFPW